MTAAGRSPRIPIAVLACAVIVSGCDRGGTAHRVIASPVPAARPASASPETEAGAGTGVPVERIARTPAARSEPTPKPAPGPVSDQRANDLLNAIRSKLVTSRGAIWSWLLDGRQEDPATNGVGHERVSESTGLFMAVSLAAGRRDLFDLAHAYYANVMRNANGVAYWKVDANDHPVGNADGSFSEAPNDELRIARALLTAGLTTESQASSSTLRRALVGGILTDDLSWTGSAPPDPGEQTNTSYLDIEAMRALGWSEADTNLAVLRGAVRDGAPPFNTVRSGAYSCDSPCPTIDGLWVGLRLAAAGDAADARRVASFYLGKLSSDGRLADSYLPTSRDEDLASYAMLARLTFRLGDRARADDIIEKHLSKRSDGLYSFDRSDAAAFDNLEVVLTFLELAGRRAPAD